MNTNRMEAGHRAVPDGRAASPAMDDLDEAASVFRRARPALLKIAHQVLGNAGEAEDALQELWLRLQRADPRAVHSRAALLRTMTVRVAVNVLHCARRRREYCATPTCRNRRTTTRPSRTWWSRGRTRWSGREHGC
ncbi:sigma factor [Streptomyces tendae]|uniref:sigma factor n=1 Tax=Streptomyces tendae TaxID=1932 RepID=UPI00381FB544